jgi:hypothetical protein
MYFDRAPRGAADLETYARRLGRSVEAYGDLFAKMTFSSLYFGGGTPSLFTARQLEAFCAVLFKHARFERDCHKTVECNPDSASGEKLGILAKWGFNKASFGVQSMDRGVLRAIGRGDQTAEMVDNSVRWAKAAGFESVNTDLMIGLPGDDGSKLLDSCRRLLRLAPTSVCLYPCTPTPFFLERHFDGSREDFNANFSTQMKALPAIKALGLKSGYRCVNNDGKITEAATTLIKPYVRGAKLSYKFTVQTEGESLLGLGVPAESSIFGGLRYSAISLGTSPARDRYAGWEFGLKKEMLLYCLQKLMWGSKVYKKDFRRLFREDLDAVFSEGIGCLKTLGLARSGPDCLDLLTDDIEERYARALFLLDSRDVLSGIRTALRNAGATGKKPG